MTDSNTETKPKAKVYVRVRPPAFPVIVLDAEAWAAAADELERDVMVCDALDSWQGIDGGFYALFDGVLNYEPLAKRPPQHVDIFEAEPPPELAGAAGLSGSRYQAPARGSPSRAGAFLLADWPGIRQQGRE